MNKKAIHTLEFDKIRQRLAEHAASKMGKELALSLEPSSDYQEIKYRQQETSEAYTMIIKRGSLVLGSLKDIRPYLKRAAVGGSLSPEELIYTGDFLYVTKRAKDYSHSDDKTEVLELLEPQFELLEPIEGLQREIERCIISDTEISDEASSALKDIRRNIKSSNDKIRQQLNSIIHSSAYKNMIQDAVITIRGDRYCVPVKSEYKNAFTGMVHDQSATGATVFIEPMSVVELNNKIKDLKAEEKAEIAKILQRLTAMVNENADVLKANLEILSHIDFVFAKAELSISMNATEPIFNQKGYVNIKKARHPLLDPKTVVPTDIYIGDKFHTLLITGPNTGGKTVSLKTLGLFTLMGQSGLHIPAFDNSELAVFDDVFSDIGDEQSIEQSLSTFSSHMKNIVDILDNVSDNCLVLLDELGAGTDPTEGAALAIAIINYLHRLKVRTAVTTHYSELKVYAITTEGVENASCEFDVETLRPTYRLLIGIPGKSNAFAISSRLGLPKFIINDAKDVLSHEDKRFEDVITDLEISKKSLIIEQERAEQYRKEAQRLKKDVENQKKQTRESKEKIILRANEQAKEIIQQAKDEADEIVRELQKMARQKASQSDMDKKREALKDKLKTAQSNVDRLSRASRDLREIPKNLKKGDRVFIHSMNQSAVVEAAPNSKGDVMVNAGIMSIKLNIKDLSLDMSKPEVEKEDKKALKRKYSMSAKAGKARSISAEVDLRGMMVLEALEKLDKYLDDAYLAGYSPVTIIHGKGTGALRSAVHEYLRKKSYIKSYRLGQYGEGEAGVTIAELN